MTAMQGFPGTSSPSFLDYSKTSDPTPSQILSPKTRSQDALGSESSVRTEVEGVTANISEQPRHARGLARSVQSRCCFVFFADFSLVCRELESSTQIMTLLGHLSWFSRGNLFAHMQNYNTRHTAKRFSAMTCKSPIIFVFSAQEAPIPRAVPAWSAALENGYSLFRKGL